MHVRTESLARLLQLLDVAAQSGILSLEPTPGYPAEIWQAQLTLLEGKVIRCLAWRKSDGALIYQGGAIPPWLFQQRELQWWLDKTQRQPLPHPTQPERSGGTAPKLKALPAQSQETSPAARSGYGRIVPRRIHPNWQGFTGRPPWTRDHRQVLLLIDGQKTAQEIATLLHKPYERIHALLEELRSGGIIDIITR